MKERKRKKKPKSGDNGVFYILDPPYCLWIKRGRLTRVGLESPLVSLAGQQVLGASRETRHLFIERERRWKPGQLVSHSLGTTSSNFSLPLGHDEPAAEFRRKHCKNCCWQCRAIIYIIRLFFKLLFPVDAEGDQRHVPPTLGGQERARKSYRSGPIPRMHFMVYRYK